jgi:hypothetical protein
VTATVATGLIFAVAVPTAYAQTATSDDNGGANREGQEQPKSFPFIPIPIFITEPAIGYGFGVAVGYFHTGKDDHASDVSDVAPAYTAGTPPGSGKDRETKRPPTITGIAGAYTDNGTWAAGIGHSASWKEDRIRYQGAIAWADVNSTFYFLNVPFDFNLEGGILYQDIRFRIRGSDFFLGAKLYYFNAYGDFTLGEAAPVGFIERDVSDGGLAFQAVWDTRDNTMTPDHGRFFEVVLWRHDEALAGKFDYWKGELTLLSFHNFSDDFVLGFRLDADTVDGRPPLWSFPWISIRGIPALRYQNELTVALETELRWNIFNRWALLGFVGVGSSWGDTRIFTDESGVVAGGVGGRWLFRPEDSLWVGVDIARGPEETYGYIQVGHAW